MSSQSQSRDLEELIANIKTSVGNSSTTGKSSKREELIQRLIPNVAKVLNLAGFNQGSNQQLANKDLADLLVRFALEKKREPKKTFDNSVSDWIKATLRESSFQDTNKIDIIVVAEKYTRQELSAQPSTSVDTIKLYQALLAQQHVRPDIQQILLQRLKNAAVVAPHAEKFNSQEAQESGYSFNVGSNQVNVGRTIASQSLKGRRSESQEEPSKPASDSSNPNVIYISRSILNVTTKDR